MWNGPKNWLLVSTKKDLIKSLVDKFEDTDFAVTDLSHSRAIIEIEGNDAIEVLKKGCPFNFNTLDKNNSCLLYTSPSPRDMRRSRMPSSA